MSKFLTALKRTVIVYLSIIAALLVLFALVLAVVYMRATVGLPATIFTLMFFVLLGWNICMEID